MEFGTNTDLLAVMQAVPPLLSACVGEKGDSEWKALRLVSKEASRVAMLAYVTHSLSLQGYANDTQISRAQLLRTTCLKTLHVTLCLTGKFCPVTC